MDDAVVFPFVPALHLAEFGQADPITADYLPQKTFVRVQVPVAW